MNRSRRATENAGVLSLSVNQDSTCIAIGSLHGIRIFNVEQGRTLFSEDYGAIKIVEMLFCTSLLAYVGAGEQPHLSPRKLTLMNTQTMSAIKTSMYRSSILAVRMNRRRLVVVLETQAIVSELENLQKLRVIETPPNPQGICDMSTDDVPSYLALPSSPDTGSIRLFDLLTDGGNLRIEIDAHKSPMSIVKFNSDSTMIATASQRGTLINVFSVPDGEKLYTLRRGSVHASILSLAFTPEEWNPRLLAAVGSHGTVHVFKLATSHLTKTMMSQVASKAVGVLTAVTSLPFDNLMDATRSCVTISLPNTAFQICCFSSLLPERSDDGISTVSDTAVLHIASSDGRLYAYTIQGLLSDGDCKAVRKDAYQMMGAYATID